jgi:hypothetical protein
MISMFHKAYMDILKQKMKDVTLGFLERPEKRPREAFLGTVFTL